ncbi:hypothetical protein GCM10010376_69190 [Streptomyces violaceusniger]
MSPPHTPRRRSTDHISGSDRGRTSPAASLPLVRPHHHRCAVRNHHRGSPQGAPLESAELPDPVADPGWVVVDVEATGRPRHQDTTFSNGKVRGRLITRPRG